jgi:DNA-binding XRE family transcriptional regulator
MRLNKWNDDRIIFWDEVYRVLSKSFDKNELRIHNNNRQTAGPDIVQIGKKIRDAREAKGWTQAELAEKSGYSQQTISITENGYINISFLTLKKILTVLDLAIAITEKKYA